MEGKINKACGLDIHKLFFIATILSRSGEKQQQCFARDDEGIFALKNWVTSEKCDVIACESTSDFWVPIYDADKTSTCNRWKCSRYEGIYTQKDR